MGRVALGASSIADSRTSQALSRPVWTLASTITRYLAMIILNGLVFLSRLGGSFTATPAEVVEQGGASRGINPQMARG